MNTIQSLEKFISELNVAGDNPDDTENFYNFCIFSCTEDNYFTEDEFYKIFKSSNNILNKQCSDEQIQDYFSRYEQYIDLLKYMRKEGFITHKEMSDEFIPE